LYARRAADDQGGRQSRVPLLAMMASRFGASGFVLVMDPLSYFMRWMKNILLPSLKASSVFRSGGLAPMWQ
jgi:hypothetical protein